MAEGTCFRLYSKLTHNTAMPAFAPPEMLRCSLVNLVLKVKMIEPSTEIGGAASGSSLLDECLQPPSLDSVRQSLEQLTYLGATAFDGGVTTLGVVLARMPQLDLRVARLLLIAHAFFPASAALPPLALNRSRTRFQTWSGLASASMRWNAGRSTTCATSYTIAAMPASEAVTVFVA